MRRLLVALLLVGLGAFVVRGGVPCEAVELQPGCYIALKPGPTEDATALVDVGDASAFSSAGQLLLTTVAVEEELGFGDWARAALSASVETVPRTVLFPAGADREEVSRQNAAMMVDSQLTATVAALRRAGYQVDEEFDGARIQEVLSTSAEEALEVGDVIVAVDGEPTSDSGEVVDAIQVREPGDEVALRLRRDGEEHDVDVELGPAPDDPQRPFLGVMLTSHLDLPVDITIDAGIIGGPSAGLMFALSILDLLEPEDLTGGAVIAGTGTLDVDGTVGAVGGVRQKVVAAAEADQGQRAASVFLVPSGNLEQVDDLAVSGNLLVVPVETLDDALEAVADVREGRDPQGALALSGS